MTSLLVSRMMMSGVNWGLCLLAALVIGGLVGLMNGLAIPGPVIMMAVVAAIASLILRYTNYGRKLYAVGGNAKAAWMSGIRTSKVIIIAYIISGLLCGPGAVPPARWQWYTVSCGGLWQVLFHLIFLWR